MELLKDYDLVIDYHPGKANVVADALSRKASVSLAFVRSFYLPQLLKLRELGVKLEVDASGVLLAHLSARSPLVEQIQEKQKMDEDSLREMHKLENGEENGFRIRADGTLEFQGRLCVSKDSALRKKILEEAHSSVFTVHPGGTKMYRSLKEDYWWSGMKWEIADFVARCLVCQQVKAKHQ